MGYYSEVGLCLAPESAKALKEAIKSLPDDELRQEISDLIESATLHTHPNGDIAYWWNWLKWYQNFADIKFIMEFIWSLPNESYYFIRIGEETEDVEIQGGYWDNPFPMGLDRSISFH